MVEELKTIAIKSVELTPQIQEKGRPSGEPISHSVSLTHKLWNW